MARWFCSRCKQYAYSVCPLNHSVYFEVEAGSANDKTLFDISTEVDNCTMGESRDGVSIRIKSFSARECINIAKIMVDHPDWVQRALCEHDWIRHYSEDDIKRRIQEEADEDECEMNGCLSHDNENNEKKLKK